MSSYMARSEDFEKKWYVIDGEGKTVGRLSTKIARILRGKEKPQFTPHADIGDFVIVVNADKVKFTGKKWEQKKYYWHTGYPGGIKSITADDLMKKKPGEIIRKAVWGMLPKNKMQDKLISRLKVYTGTEHPHVSQQPENLEV
ncbi:MAG: 50S ribosomal protein L13 [Candidatus Dadabacteria bacterium]|jgi:large subunit ribosomal protein L13|nr:50S ribosomal protein L13 [Candidatus Dadabacteria bacterium]